jgi:hypothetical protein
LASIEDPALKEKLAEDALENKYTCMQIRQIRKIFEEDQNIKENVYLEHKDKNDGTDIVHIDKKSLQRLFNKMIILLKNTSRNMMPIIDGSEENWIVYTTFIQHKKIIDTQIDTLIKEKKKIMERLRT